VSAARVAVVATGDPASPTTWSGSGAGLVAGLRRRGVEVVTVDAAPPAMLNLAGLAASGAVRRSRVDANHTRGMDALRSLTAARRLRAAGPVDGAIVLGAEQRLPRGMRYVVSADMTLLQARATHPVFSRLSEGTANAFAERQRQVYDHAVALAPWSHWAARSLVEDYGADPARVHVVGAGRNHEVEPRARPWSPPRFLFVGREWERKGGPVVLEAFAAVHRALPDARLDVVGEHPPLDQRGVTGHGLLGFDVPDEARRVEALFAAATCFVMPSAVEPLGIVYAEAAAAGVPSIGSTVGGAWTIIGDEGGRLVPPGDRAALEAAMLELSDPETARRTGEAARERAAAFTWDAVAGRMLRALGPPGVDLDGLPEFL
jgi:glycosyltransferase involved in cell wall biosynthesis